MVFIAQCILLPIVQGGCEQNVIAFHVKGGGIPEHPVHANRFRLAQLTTTWLKVGQLPSNITIGAFRAPRSNFNAAAEQSFLDELAELQERIQ